MPEAKENVLPSDKEIAYEQALLDQKQSQQEAALGGAVRLLVTR
ncbi:hypothetical protein QIU19_11250 [Capnocytophaga canimorsus]|nr:hypothetical protein [Capnocytophaga canimorsus]WGU67964.1 hypothetical protein QIU19_11250 [Capnocytophaga canimorsus]